MASDSARSREKGISRDGAAVSGGAFPQPFPQPIPSPFEVDFGRLFLSVQEAVRESRGLRQQPPLSPDNSILWGKENYAVWDQVTAPAILIIPVGVTFKQWRPDGDLPPVLRYLSQWLLFDVHCWGDDVDGGLGSARGYSTALELARQVYCAFVEYAQGGQVRRGQVHTKIESCEFRQTTNVNRQGRVLFFRLAQEAFLISDPPILAPVATETTPGVQASVTVQMGQPPPSPPSPDPLPPFLVPPSPNGSG